MNLSEQVKSRTYWQYRNSEKLIEWMDILPSIAQTEIEDPAQFVADILDIDNLAGEQLDIVGRIVGLDRPAIDLEPQVASDDLFLLLIKSRIEKNNGDATIDNIIRAAKFVAGVDDVTVQDNQDMTWSLNIKIDFDSTTRFAFINFDILPRPQGTQYTIITETENIAFGFSEFPNTLTVNGQTLLLNGEPLELALIENEFDDIDGFAELGEDPLEGGELSELITVEA